jgi:hypothetical protein
MVPTISTSTQAVIAKGTQIKTGNEVAFDQLPAHALAPVAQAGLGAPSLLLPFPALLRTLGSLLSALGTFRLARTGTLLLPPLKSVAYQPLPFS